MAMGAATEMGMAAATETPAATVTETPAATVTETPAAMVTETPAATETEMPTAMPGAWARPKARPPTVTARPQMRRRAARLHRPAPTRQSTLAMTSQRTTL